MSNPEGLVRLGTCSWSLREWVGKVYTANRPGEFLREYAQQFSTVEIDATFYGVPRRDTLLGWRDRTPDGFLFAAKAPQVITHEKFLEDCDREVDEFLGAMALLGDRVGPLLFQFPYFAKRRGVTLSEFVDRLDPFLERLPKAPSGYAVEVRNKAWIGDRLLGVLRRHAVPLVLIDHPWMAPPQQLIRTEGILTGPFAYIRWLGDRHAIEKMTTTWGDTVVDRRSDLAPWVQVIRDLLDRGFPVFGYVNSHYSGYAPGDVALIRQLLGTAGREV